MFRLSGSAATALNRFPFVTQFDRILVDVPCSGTGTIQRNPEIKWRLKREDLARHPEVQRRLLENALPQLKPGGRLVYSTCSLEPEENEQVVEPVLAAQPDFSLLRKDELGKEVSRPGVHSSTPRDGSEPTPLETIRTGSSPPSFHASS